MESLLLRMLAVAGLLAACWACTPTATQDCLNGVAYDPTQMFACRNDLYYWDTTGCCTQGIPFDLATQFCCFDGVHDKDNSECAEFIPDNASAASNSTTLDLDALMPPLAFMPYERSPFSTSNPNGAYGNECQWADSQNGCLNGYKYDWDTEYPCVDWILNFSSQGCCVDDWYFFENQTCCYNPDTDAYKVFDKAHACAAELL